MNLINICNERRGVKKALCIGTVMFFLGVLLGYFMVYPLTLRFLSTYELSAAIENQISLNSYIDNFMMLVLCMGLAFELPLVTWLLSLLGLVHKSFLRKYRRHALVIIVICQPTGLFGFGVRTCRTENVSLHRRIRPLHQRHPFRCGKFAPLH